MPRSTPVSMPDYELHWSNTHENTHSTVSDIPLAEPVCPSPPPMSTWMKPSTSVLHTGHLSPVSPGRDSASSESSRVNSTSLSHTDTWPVEGVLRDDASTLWTDDGGLAPKLEVDEEFGGLLDVPAVETRDFEVEGSGFADGRGELGAETGSRKVGERPPKKKPRGRPRKHPLTPVGGLNKPAKPRSKTGCITCRKRKKKCDEAKPRCMNCEKNAVVCEGYHEKQMWKSGKERAEEAHLRSATSPVITMPPIFNGVETPEDKVFWRHYCNHLSNVLTVESEHRNAFKDIVLRLATRHQGLMHSVLSLSAEHIDYETPYGMKILDDGAAGVTLSSLRDRAEYHHEEAMECLYADMRRSEDPADPEYKTVLMARYGQMLCLLLKTMVEGNPRGDHRVHLKAYRRLMHHSPPEDSDFRDFITEFFEYHIFADELLSPPGPEGRMAEYPTSSLSPSPSSLHEPRLVGVTDGLFTYMSQITAIRDTIRENMRSGADHAVDYPSLYRAAEIDAAVRDWSPCWPAGDSRNRLALLYKQAVWVYLFRTIYPPCEGREQRGDGADFTTSTESESDFGGEDVLGTSASGDTSTPSPSSPPTRAPDLQDPRITTALNESLALLETFKPSDPSQRLLLIPCLLLGTACFEPEQQGMVRRAVGRVRGYTGLRNCDLLAGVLEGVWGAMGTGEWRGVWEWEGVAGGMGVDFLCA